MKRLIIAITALVVSTQMASAAPLGQKGYSKGNAIVVKVHSTYDKKSSKDKHDRWKKKSGKSQIHRNAKKRIVKKRIVQGRVIKKRGKRFYGRGKPHRWQKRGCWKIGPVWYCPAH